MKDAIPPDAAEFPVQRTRGSSAVPKEPEPDWVDDAELRRLKKRFQGTTPQGREVMRKLLVRARRKLWGLSAGQIEVQFAGKDKRPFQIHRTKPI
jgi:hypothetical protein